MSDESDSENRRRELIAEIVAAFEGVAREEGTTIHEAIAKDDWKTYEEQQAAKRLDTEERWQDVPEEELMANHSALSFLDEKGFRYYLPAYMVCELANWDDPDSNTASCEFRLLHESQRSLRKSEPASIAAKYDFTPAQGEAIAHYLRFAIGEDDEFTTHEATILRAVEKWENFVGE